MSEIDEIGIRGIPKGSKLMILGDWYRRPGQEWKIVCYFHNQEQGYFREALPIDLLPALAVGTHFPRTSTENKAQGWTETIILPEQAEWRRMTYRDVPESLQRAHEFSGQFENGIVYRILSGGKVYWLPAIELARMLFFHSAEVTRAAVDQGNTWQLGKAWATDWIGNVVLSSNTPVRYINSLQYRKFFTWLFFDSDVENSFGSIFQHIHSYSTVNIDADRWIFDFMPPDISQCEIFFSGFTGREPEGNHVYIREIRAISGLTPPDLDIVYFSHPDDILFVQKEPEEGEEKKPPLPSKPPVNVKEFDPKNRPKASKRRHYVKVGRMGLNFEVELDTRRSPRQVQMLPPNTLPELDENEEQKPEELAGIREGSDTGKGPRAEIDNLEPPDKIDAPEKIVFFQAMLQKLEAEYGWRIETLIGNVPKKRCRSQHLVDGRARSYCYAMIFRDETTIIQLLEIELTNKTKKNGDKEPESLSTLFFRTKDNTSIYLNILDELMTSYKDQGLNAMNWKRKLITEKTYAREYLGHPENKIKSEEGAMESWVARAAQKVIGM
jgi:hypothetical protein